MKKIRKEKEIKSLNEKIQLAQMEKFANEFDMAMKKDLIKSLKKLALIFIPLLLPLIGYLAFDNTLLLLIGGSIASIVTITMGTIDFKNDLKRIRGKSYQKGSESQTEEEKSLEQVLNEGIGQKRGKDFYKDEYKNVLERTESSEDKKYKEVLERQQRPSSPSNFRLIDNEKKFLDKNETMIQVAREIDAYCKLYQLPPLIIANNIWNIFFDIIHRVFAENGIEERFYDSMSELNRLVFAKALVNKTANIDINNFITNLQYLENYGIKKTEITAIKNEIISKIKTVNIINFSDYVNKKSGKK